ncbi:MAG: PEGA domain-containing protein [Dysgonomonas sp.]|nr:PEGA domain-containing protein [Dysgonomonas sp.]
MKKIILGLATIISFSSCATIISGSSQSVSFSSYPSNATVYDNNTRLGRKPVSAKLKRKDKHSIVIELDGYQPYELVLERKFNAWFIGNILLGGLIGVIVDPITGAMYKLTPDQVHAEFNNGVAFKQEKDNIYVAVTLKKNNDWEQIGTLEKQ